jgi:hypothetical protein
MFAAAMKPPPVRIDFVETLNMSGPESRVPRGLERHPDSVLTLFLKISNVLVGRWLAPDPGVPSATAWRRLAGPVRRSDFDVERPT